ncbi:hypothetical protein [Aphanothece hegewaldii]|uniref:hypothetical protein n=1 Tax=Aphanothece hegewaldii TaxID=1521625 RepID=UPI001FE505E3|nr:hypothetical protein [Aphanothece hegewaldii]
MKYQEIDELEELERKLERGELDKMRKQASYENYRKRNSRPEFNRQIIENMQPVKFENWNIEDNNQVLILAGVDGEPLALKHNVYICQNERSFRPSRYVAFYNEAKIRYLFEVVDKPYDYCNWYNTPIRRTINPHPESSTDFRRVIYLKFKTEVGPIENDTIDKNGKIAAFTQGHRYTTIERLMKAQKTSELVNKSDLLDDELFDDRL